MRTGRRIRRVVGGVLASSIGGWMVLAPGVAVAVEPSVYAAWTIASSPTAPPPHNGTVTVPATGFPGAQWMTDGDMSLDAGSTTYLTEATPFGAQFGSSQDQQFADFGPAPGDATTPGAQPSAAAITFDAPTPASGWGFAVGFEDAGILQIEAVDANGVAVDAEALGWQDAFNYCGVNPAPPSCSGAPVDVVPVWEPTTMRLIGNDATGHGPAGWFMPTMPLQSLTFNYTPVADDEPRYKIWIADSVTTVSGQVQLVESGTTSQYAGATVRLLDADGNPVTNPDGSPVTTETGPDGTYAFPGLARDTYGVAVDVPPGTQPVGAAQAPVDATAGDVDGVDFQLTPLPAPVPPTPPSPDPAPQPVAPATPPTSPAGGTGPGGPGGQAAPQPQLAATGADNAGELALVGLGLLAVGSALVVGTRLRKR